MFRKLHGKPRACRSGRRRAAANFGAGRIRRPAAEGPAARVPDGRAEPHKERGAAGGARADGGRTRSQGGAGPADPGALAGPRPLPATRTDQGHPADRNGHTDHDGDAHRLPGRQRQVGYGDELGTTEPSVRRVGR